MASFIPSNQHQRAARAGASSFPAENDGADGERLGRIIVRLDRPGEIMDKESLAKLRLGLLGMNAAEADTFLEQLELGLGQQT